MITNELTAADYSQTFQPPMQDVTATAEQVIDIWPYVGSIPVAGLGGFMLKDVAYVYRNNSNAFEHVLIGTDDKNVFLVIVLSLAGPEIYGYHLLDLVTLYGLTEE
ncbi:hypothetical protein [Hymenobacter nivis]|uniref:Uncharacterized protein n=1 Tax=Hymenobacter nivis TaxID=1850093 RepID=A0A502HF73_9BACT|nr:hypothetical protein [Hymenobacter nivis]TPG72163.1 hypothetical protein EAH73_02685 [Hymenobacter nivis]